MVRTGNARPDEIEVAKLMFHRRHVNEHLGGEADEKYIADSGDKVRVKQALHETVQTAHRIVGIVQMLAVIVHRGFHEIFPGGERPIKRHQERQQPAR